MASEAAESSADMRTSQRHRVLKKVAVIPKGSESRMNCLLRSISDTGARMEFPAGIPVPHEFLLIDDLDGFRVFCELKWSRENVHGVQFTSPRETIPVKRTQVLNPVNNALAEAEMAGDDREKLPIGKPGRTFGKRG